MYKLREFIFRFKNQIFFTLMAVVISLGAYIGYWTVDRYAVFARGVLGCTVLYFIYRQYKEATEEPTGLQVDLKKDLRFLPGLFLISIIGMWATIQVVQMVLYLINLFRNP